MASDRVLILASASPRRADLLREAGVPFEIRRARVREQTRRDGPNRTVGRLAIHNALLKAGNIARRFPGRWVLGADTLVALGRTLFGKPRDLAEAGTMLARLQGRTHRVVTGVVFCRQGSKPRSFAVATRVTFKTLTARQIRDYLRRIHPLDKAGAYAAQSHTDRIIQGVAGSFSNIVGLPMERTLREWQRCVAEESRPAKRSGANGAG